MPKVDFSSILSRLTSFLEKNPDWKEFVFELNEKTLTVTLAVKSTSHPNRPIKHDGGNGYNARLTPDEVNLAADTAVRLAGIEFTVERLVKDNYSITYRFSPK